MAFIKAQIQIAPATIGTGIKLSLRRTRNAPAKMLIGVTASAAMQLGWADGDKLEVMIGEDEHHGLMRVRKNSSVGEATVQKKESPKGPWFSVALGRQPAFVDRTESAQWCRWELIEDGWVEIVMPKWADETGPSRAGKVVAMAPAVARPTTPVSAVPQPAVPVAQERRGPGRPAKSVTSSLMGDPPAGRREMLARMGEMKG